MRRQASTNRLFDQAFGLRIVTLRVRYCPGVPLHLPRRSDLRAAAIGCAAVWTPRSHSDSKRCPALLYVARSANWVFQQRQAF